MIRHLKLGSVYLFTVMLIIIGLMDLRAPASKVVRAAGPIPAFPGAEGFGAEAVGGRGGQVIEVTNLNDSGPGSLRACAEASGPRTCVFRVAGTIQVKSRINVWNAYLTIAGQTAPGGGITLRNAPSNKQAPMAILTHDVIIRHIRFRPGPTSGSQESSTVDGLTIVNEADEDHPDSVVYNVIIDHVSFSWAMDEVVNIAKDSRDITIQWSIISEGLPEGPISSKGMLVSADGAKNITVHHNLFAHNEGRNPHIDTSGIVDVVNNVIYAPANTGATVLGSYNPNKFPVNFVGNYGMTNPDNNDGMFYLIKHIGNNHGAKIYVKGNIDPWRTADNQPENLVVDPEDRHYIVGTRHNAPPVTTTSAFQAFNQVLAQAGATLGLNAQGQFFGRRDTVDQRVVNDTKNGTGGVIDDPSEVGGWPQLAPGTLYPDADHDGMSDVWENIYDFNPSNPSDRNQDTDQDGYTNLEEFLNGTHPGLGSKPAPTATATKAPTPTKPSTLLRRIFLPTLFKKS